MTTFNIPNESANVGLPSQGSDVINPGYIPLITGSQPEVLQVDMSVAASQTFAAYTVVGLDGSGNLIPAVLGTTQAIGFTIIAITTPGSGALKGVPIYRAGCFNPDLLVWDASYNTGAKKRDAFLGAPTPTQIVMRKPKTATVS